MENFLRNLWIALILCFFVSSGFAAEESASPPSVQKPISTEPLPQKSLREEVKTLRHERREQMPYLDRAYIRSSIHKDLVKEKQAFISKERKTLQDLIDRAIQVHTPVRAAHERISLARRRIITAIRALFPEANVEFQHREGVLSASPFNSRNYRFSFRQPIFRGGVLWNTLLQENSGLQAAENEYDQVISDIVRDVSLTYFEYLRAREVSKDQAQTVESMRRFVDISDQKFKEQIISEIEKLNVESLFSQLEYDHETAKQELELAELDLQKFLDLKTDEQVDVVEFYDVNSLVAKGAQDPNQPQKVGASQEQPFQEKIIIPNLDSLVDLSYEHRPELQVQTAKLQSARLEERIRWGELLPHGDVVLEFGRLGEAFDVDTRDPKLRQEFRMMLELSWNVGGNKINYTFENDERAPSVSQFQSGAGTQITRNNASIGLLDGLDAFADTKQAEVEKLEQIVELENAEKEVIHDVKLAYFDYQKAMIQLESTIKRVDYRKRLALLAKHRLEQNEVQISEYLQAEMDLIRERAELHKALKDYFTAKAQLNHAVGMLELMPMEAKDGK